MLQVSQVEITQIKQNAIFSQKILVVNDWVFLKLTIELKMFLVHV
jgi:hypothetical protein